MMVRAGAAAQTDGPNAMSIPEERRRRRCPASGRSRQPKSEKLAASLVVGTLHVAADNGAVKAVSAPAPYGISNI